MALSTGRTVGDPAYYTVTTEAQRWAHRQYYPDARRPRKRSKVSPSLKREIAAQRKRTKHYSAPQVVDHGVITYGASKRTNLPTIGNID